MAHSARHSYLSGETGHAAHRVAVHDTKDTRPMAQTDDFDAPEQLLTPSEVAAMFRVNPKTVTRWARAGKLTAIRTLGGHRRFRVSEIKRSVGVRSPHHNVARGNRRPPGRRLPFSAVRSGRGHPDRCLFDPPERPHG